MGKKPRRFSPEFKLKPVKLVKGGGVKVAQAARATATLLLFAVPAVAQINVDDLGTLGGTAASATAVNARGEIVGESPTLFGFFRGFVWRETGFGLPLGTERQITSSPTRETTPRLGNDGVSDLVVFTSHEWRADGFFEQADIWYQRVSGNGFAQGPAVQVTSDLTDDRLNDISGDYIVYIAFDLAGSQGGTIMLYRISTGVLQPLGKAALMREARIHGNTVVWRRGSAGTGEVMIYDLAWLGTGQEAQPLTGPDPPTHYIDIGDRFVVWAEGGSTQFDVGHFQFDIGAYDLAGGQRLQITSTTTVEERFPSTSGDWIAWSARDAGATNRRIEALNLETGEFRVVVDDGSEARLPSLDGNLLAYDSDVNGSFDVFAYRIDTRETFPVTTDPADQYLSDVFGGLVAWVDREVDCVSSCNDDIYLKTAQPVPMQDLGTLGGPTSSARDINDTGRVVGFSDNPTVVKHAFVVTPEDVLPAGNPDGVPETWYKDVDGNGRNDLMQDLGPVPLGESFAYGINELGQVVGRAGNEAVLWQQDGTLMSLGWLDPLIWPEPFSIASAVNDAGQVAGMSKFSTREVTDRAFLVTPLDNIGGDGIPDTWLDDADAGGVNDLMLDLTTTGRSWLDSRARDVNDAGQAVGSGNASAVDPVRAVLWDPVTGDTQIGTLGGSESAAYAINDSGQVTGKAFTAAETSHGFLWSLQGGILDLGSLAPGAVSIGWDLDAGGGTVVGMAHDAAGNPRAVRWTLAPNTGVGVSQDVSLGPAVTVTFDLVDRAGLTTLTESTTNPGPPGNFQFLGSFLHIATSAGFAGNAIVCVEYDDTGVADENTLELLHLEDGAWVDVTTSRDPADHVICGEVTSFSWFAVAEPA